MRVMTFNIRYGTAEDGPNAWLRRRERVVDVIRLLDPDILGVQEALDFQVSELANALPDRSWVGVGRDDGDRAGEFGAIFLRSEMALRESGSFWFSDTPNIAGSKHPECFHPRLCTWARLPHFTVYNLHLDNESSAARSQAMEILLSRADERAIAMGDFNTPPHDAIFTEMGAAGFVDATAACVGPSYHGFGAVSEGERIDFIWARGFSLKGATIVTTAGAASDHYPVVADFGPV